jgi:hypothetical protein
MIVREQCNLPPASTVSTSVIAAGIRLTPAASTLKWDPGNSELAILAATVMKRRSNTQHKRSLEPSCNNRTSKMRMCNDQYVPCANPFLLELAMNFTNLSRFTEHVRNNCLETCLGYDRVYAVHHFFWSLTTGTPGLYQQH